MAKSKEELPDPGGDPAKVADTRAELSPRDDAAAGGDDSNRAAPSHADYRIRKVECVLWSSPEGKLVASVEDLIADGGIRDDLPLPIRWNPAQSDPDK